MYFIAADPNETGAEVERRYVELVASVRQTVSIPLAVKIGPYFSSVPNMAGRLVEAGADGLVVFNRFVQPDINLDTLEVERSLHLSTSEELLLGLRWIAILHGRVDASLAATTGVHTSEDALKVLLAGADVAMMASALFRHGPEHVSTIRDGIATWLEDRGYASLAQMKGSLSDQNVENPVAYTRANYMKMLVDFTSPYDWREIPGSVQT